MARSTCSRTASQPQDAAPNEIRRTEEGRPAHARGRHADHRAAHTAHCGRGSAVRRLTSTAVPVSAKRGSAMRRTVWPSVPTHTHDSTLSPGMQPYGCGDGSVQRRRGVQRRAGLHFEHRHAWAKLGGSPATPVPAPGSQTTGCQRQRRLLIPFLATSILPGLPSLGARPQGSPSKMQVARNAMRITAQM